MKPCRRHKRGKPAQFRPGWYCARCRAFIEDKSAKAKVLKEFPSAHFDPKSREIKIYTEGCTLGRGSVVARSIETSAWADAAKKLGRVGGRADG